MTPEETRKAKQVLFDGAELANKIGPMLLDEAGGKGMTAVVSSAIIFSTLASSMNMTLHEAMEFFMTIHKQTIALERQA